MHGYSSGSTVVVNAEVDSMGGVIESGVGIGLKTSPRRAAIEKAQAELRLEYDIRQERRRELDFLEKGGNPLDFRIGSATSISVQSTSVTDQHLDQFVTSEAKVSCAFTASPHGDSVESSGRPRAPSVCEPNSADNLLLFDADIELPEGERKSRHPMSKNNITQSEPSSQLEGSQNAKETEDSAIFRPYARRNRSKTNRDAARSSSADVVARGGQVSSAPARGGSKDSKGFIPKINNQQEKNTHCDSNVKSVGSNGDMALRTITSADQLSLTMNDAQASKSTACTTGGGQAEIKLDDSTSKCPRGDQKNQSCHAQQVSTVVACAEPQLVGQGEQLAPVVEDSPICLGAVNNEFEPSFVRSNDFNEVIGISKLANGSFNGNITVPTKGLDLECSSTQCNQGLYINSDSDMYINTKNADSSGLASVQMAFQQLQDPEVGDIRKEKDDFKASFHCNEDVNCSIIKDESAIHVNRPGCNEGRYNSPIQGVKHNESSWERKVDDMVGDVCNSQKSSCSLRTQGFSSSCYNEVPGTILSVADPSSASNSHLSPVIDVKSVDKAREDSILEEARMIQAKHKRIAELSVHALPLENRRKSHWDFVIEEMTWLANDFAQERFWKITAAAQLCQQVTCTARIRFVERKKFWKLKEVAHALAKAVMQFWYSAEEVIDIDDPGSCPGNNKDDLIGIRKDGYNELSNNRIGEPNMESRKELKQQYGGSFSMAMQKYAVRFLKYNSSVGSLHAEAPKTPDRLSDPGILESSGVDQLKESLFYKIPLGAMNNYRRSIETHLMRLEFMQKISRSMQEEVETSMYDNVADIGFQENSYFEDDGDASMSIDYGAFEGNKSYKVSHKRRKNSTKSFAGRSYEVSDFPYGYCSSGSQQSTLIGKRPSSLNIGTIPTKRTRTASRQRVISPFHSSTAVIGHTQAKTDASSGDTCSFQDDHSTLHGASLMQRSVEIDSIGDFDDQIPYETVETSMKHKKKKKAKHLVSSYDHGWQMDSTVFSVQRDNSKRRLENHHFESNGMSGLYVQSNMKKPKTIKQSLENTFDNINPMTGSTPSPVASQMSNMSNTNRIIKLIGGRDRSRKAKALKMSAGNSSSGSPWSLFEDQALVVLVHDMGPNWELVSDAINSTLQFKCIFRKPKECKERHKILMDKSAGDGADSAEDSGTSQPYPSTLPGIPKGSARQLFQRLQEPVEEDTLKSHFEKIIKIGHKHYFRRSQNDNWDAKQLAPVHNSHFLALSQVCPNNLNGGVLTPLDLSDASNTDALSLGYQSSHANGLAVSSNQGAAASILPSAGANSPLQGSSAIALGSNVSSFSGSVNTSVRDGRYSIPRMSSLPVDEQQRLQHYNQMLPGRNFQQSNLSASVSLSSSERSVKMLPGGNATGLVGGMNRNMPVPRPAFQGGVASSPMLNSVSVVSSSVVGIPSHVNIHPNTSQGNTIARPHDGLHMTRPVHNPEHQRPMMIPELQIQVTQGSSQGVSAFNGLSSSFTNQTSPTIQPYPGHQQPHQMSPQSNHTISTTNQPHLQAPNHSAGSPQHAYPSRFPKERQLQQQRYLQQQQQQVFASSNSLLPQSQPPLSSSFQNSPQIHPQTLSNPTPGSSLTPSSPVPAMLSQHQQKHQVSQGLNRNPGSSGSNNQIGKQRQRQPQQLLQLQQPGRNHPQLRQQTQSQQPAKHLKGVGKGNMLMHQNLAHDPSHLNGLTMPSGNQVLEKGENIMQMVQGQSFPASGLNAAQPSKPSVIQSSTHSQLQQKLRPGSESPTTKQVQQMPSHQTVSSPMMVPNHQQLKLQPQPSQKQLDQRQPSIQRMLQPNRQANSDPFNKAQLDQQPVDKTSQGITISTVPQSSADSASAVPKRKSSEGDSTIPSSSAMCDSNGSPPLTNSAGSEPRPFTQGSYLKQSSVGMTNHGLNVVSQFPQEALLHTSPTQPTSSQKQEQVQERQSPQHHVHLQQHSRQQSQHLQRGESTQSSKYTNS